MKETPRFTASGTPKVAPPKPKEAATASPPAQIMATLNAMEGLLSDQAKTAAKTPVKEKPSEESLELESFDDKDTEFNRNQVDPELVAARKKYATLRKETEARSGSLDYTTILQDGTITQRVIVTPNLLVVTLGTVTEAQALFALDQARAVASHDQSLFIRTFALNELTLGIRSLEIAGKEQILPKATDDKGTLTGPLFQARVDAFKVPVEWYRIIGANYHWFRERVAKAVEGPDLGNG